MCLGSKVILFYVSGYQGDFILCVWVARLFNVCGWSCVLMCAGGQVILCAWVVR